MHIRRKASCTFSKACIVMVCGRLPQHQPAAWQCLECVGTIGVVKAHNCWTLSVRHQPCVKQLSALRKIDVVVHGFAKKWKLKGEKFKMLSRTWACCLGRAPGGSSPG